MRAIIIAAGEATRWNNYMGVPKHLIEIDGEPIIHRTVRLLNERDVNDIYVVGPDDERYRIDGSELYIPNKNPRNHDADKFLNSAPLWHPEDRTVVFYGDVYFTDDAMDKIVASKIKRWRLFCRFGKSSITGTPYGECFAQSFYPIDITRHRKALEYIAQLREGNVINRCGGWEHARAMHGARGRAVRAHRKYPGYIEINDWTDDFDKPQDYDRFIENWNRTH